MGPYEMEIDFVDLFLQLHERKRKAGIVQWVREHPGYWTALCETKAQELSPDYIESVAQSLKENHLLELQMVWLWKCRDIVDINGYLIRDDPED